MNRVRVLYIDASEGCTAASLLAALLDLGVAPSPLLAGVADLRLPHEVHLEPGRVLVRPPQGEVMVSPLEAEDALSPLAADAVGRLIVDALQEDALRALVDGGVLCLLHATALAVEQLAPDEVRATDAGPLSPDGRALLEALTPEGLGAREPDWRGPVAWGASKDAPRTRVALGEA